MHDQMPAKARGTAADLDPEVRRFVELMGASWAQHPPLGELPVTEARRVAEQVRAPWTRGGPPMRRTGEYRVPFGDTGIRIRLLDPTGGGAMPALVYLHGGGWTLFSIDTHDRLMREYAQRAQVAVVGVDYSLSPEERFPRALHETVAVIEWLRAHGPGLGIDRDRIAVGGDSAGANLSVAAALSLRDRGLGDMLKGMLLNYGAYDNTCSYPSYRHYGGAGYMLGDDEMRSFWHNYLGDTGRNDDPLACPLRADLEGLPPAWLTVAECDVLYGENIAMIERLRGAGVPVQARTYAGTTHSFLEALSISAVAGHAMDDGARWLRCLFTRC
ncbi:MAG: alpha/beta hydrolase [Steroidobacteraceae bacterium]